MSPTYFTINGHLAVLLFVLPAVENARPACPTIGIIGGGIGGTSCAHFVRQLFGSEAIIDLYEPGEIGGRLATAEIAGFHYEAGGSTIHPANQYMANFTEMLGLKKRELSDNSGGFGIYDGQQFVFRGSSYSVIQLFQLLWHYGWDMVRLDREISAMLHNFSKIYDHQESGFSFLTVESLLSSMSVEFVNQLHIGLKSSLKDKGYRVPFIEELVAAAMRVNYGQDASDVQSFVGSISLAGAQPGLWAVAGGNKLVPRGLLDKADITLLKSRVSEIISVPSTKDGSYIIRTVSSETHSYDIVIIAVPLEDEISGIRFVNFSNSLPKFFRRYQPLEVTFVEGIANKEKFGAIEDVLVYKAGIFFNSLGLQSPVDGEGDGDGDGDIKVWKVFSALPLTEEQINMLFQEYKNITRVHFKAYPHYSKDERDIPPFELDANLYYVNSIEISASAMEMSAIGARNVALLAFNRWMGRDELVLSSSLSNGREELFFEEEGEEVRKEEL